MLRRDFIRGSLYLAGYTLVSTSFLRRAQAATGIPYQSLLDVLPANSAHLVRPSDAQYAAYNIAFNKRTQLAPQIRLLTLNAEAVAAAVRWVRENNIPFAVRCGGHSYEGFSQSSSFVIDLRLMNSITIANERAIVGGGAALGPLYAALGKKNRAIAAGSCPTVGVGGHTTGGGFGFLTRAFGLACDQIESFEIVTADGRIQQASAQENSDLYWACRGGGGGSFGVITSYTFITQAVDSLAVFGMGWTLPAAKAAQVLCEWENWAPNAPNEITSVMRVTRDLKTGQVSLRCVGQSLDSASRLRTQLTDLLSTHPSSPLQIQSMDFTHATRHFAGSQSYTTSYMAGKSDYAKAPIGTAGFTELCRQFESLPTGGFVIMDSYGGAVKELAPDANAFAHREALFGMQFASYWNQPSETNTRMKELRQVHQAMRPFVSGSAYVNYPDGDLQDYRTAYWGDNLTRLLQIKAQTDPTNLFHHRQSV